MNRVKPCRLCLLETTDGVANRGRSEPSLYGNGSVSQHYRSLPNSLHIVNLRFREAALLNASVNAPCRSRARWRRGRATTSGSTVRSRQQGEVEDPEAVLCSDEPAIATVADVEQDPAEGIGVPTQIVFVSASPGWCGWRRRCARTSEYALIVGDAGLRTAGRVDRASRHSCRRRGDNSPSSRCW